MALKIDDLQAVLDINRKINSIEDVRSILNDISHYAGELLKAEGASILLVDPETGNLFFEVAFGENADALSNVIVPKGKGIAGYAAQKKEHVIVYDAENDDRFYKEVDQKTNLKTKSLLAMPLIHNDNAIGVIEVINPARKVFTDDDVILLKQFAEQAATAIANALLYKAAQMRSKELEYLYQISNLTNLTYDRKVLFAKIVELLSKIFNSHRVSIMFINEKTGNLYIESAIGMPQDVVDKMEHSLDIDKISSRAIKQGKTFYSNDIEKTGLGRNKRFRYKNTSFISCPIKIKNICVGVINISEPKKWARYTPEMIKTLRTIANQVGYTYESMLSYIKQLEHEKIKKEIEIMKTLQNALLISDFNSFKTVSVFAKMLTAEIVGGDFYDIYNLTPNRIGFVIGDVSGKGLPASLYMAVSRSVVKAYAFHTKEPHRLLEYSNDILVEDSRVGMFVTMFYGCIDLNRMALEYSNAGHNLQYLYKPDEGLFISLSSKGIPLGISKSENYVSTTTQLEHGDIIFCFTDGIIDAVNDKGTDFGLDRLKRIFREYSSLNASAIVNIIFRELDLWSNGAPQWDDMTLLVFKIP
jgi:sigma-B regulation protein RsbU (phosphoserine phosphatase)